MKLAIMQPYFFPYIGYFQLIQACDKLVIFDDVNYIKKGWINRNQLLFNGGVHYFTIPLSGASQNKKISEITVMEDESKWRNNMIKTFQQAYSKAPFLNNVLPMLQRILFNSGSSVSDIARASILETLNYLDIQKTIIHSSSVYNNHNLKGENRILDICKTEGANTYLNLTGGKDLYKNDQFTEKGIQLKFVSSNFSFEENHLRLSIVHFLMNQSKDDILRKILSYSLV
jgi:hypothetical protein